MRAKWKGVLKFGLVQVPVRLFKATESKSTVSFNQIHDCGDKGFTRLKQTMHCPTCDVAVAHADIKRGYEVAKGTVVEITDEEIEAVMVEATKTIDVSKSSPLSDLNPIYIQATDYVAPDGPAAAESFVVMRDGLRQRGEMAVGTFVSRGREDIVAVCAQGDGMLLHHLHYATEVRDMAEIPELANLPKSKPAELKMATQLLASYAGPLDLDEFHDTYAEELKALTVAKAAGKKPKARTATVETPQVSSLLAQLQGSLQAAPAKPKKRKAS